MNEIIYFIIGFIGTFIGTLAGGGGLITLPAMLVTGVPIHSAIAANKFSNIFSSFSSFFVLLRDKKIKLKQALIVAPFSLLGGISGGLFATSLSENSMTIIAICLLSVALILNFIKKNPKERNENVDKVPKKVVPYLYGIGVYDGMFGPGQGTLLMYSFLHHGFSYISAIAFTRFQTFLSCLGAFLIFFTSGHLNWNVTVYLAIGSILGAQLSVRFAQKISAKHLQFILRIVTVMLILQLSYRIIW
ncbi:sulfite exporter TauE/SafE family protein [Fredinandcohnia sp. 179-A 10B2 NHS]|uniref:sulfite exporter TauE/SafE family protein n=1 Tax=Fredinandcohnia sp. 179-A 10B2 NHS TaxID=3235176 RepID=UPI00399FF6BB